MGGGQWLEQQQYPWVDEIVPQAMECPECPTCNICEVCPEWIQGTLDPIIQWGRDNIVFFDIWLIISAILGGLILLISLPFSHKIIKRVINIIKTVWKRASGEDA